MNTDVAHSQHNTKTLFYLMTEAESLTVTSLNLHHSAELQHVLNKECVRGDTVCESNIKCNTLN
jgi:hypothetical protein